MEETVITKDEIRKIQVVRVLALQTNRGLSKTKACEIVGISVSTYDRWRSENSNTAIELLSEVQGPLHDLYEEVVASRIKLIQKLQLDAQEEDLSPRDAIAIEKRFEEIQKGIQEELALVDNAGKVPEPQDPAGEKALTIAEEFVNQKITGPRLRHGAGVTVTETKTTKFEVTDDSTPIDAIDGEIKS